MIEANRKAFSGQRSISQHPLFAAIVALWFGALFALGSLAVGAIVIPGLERPLEFVERVALALVMAAIGGILGALLARRVARRRGDGVERMPYAESAVFDELEDAMAKPARRRSLTALEDSPSPDHAEDFAPAPEGEAAVLDLADADCDALADVAPTPAPDAADDDQSQFCESLPQDDAAETVEAASDGQPEAGALTPEPDDSFAWLAEFAIEAPAISQPPANSQPEAAASDEGVAADEGDAPEMAVAAPAEDGPAAPIAAVDLSTLSAVELLGRLALAMARRRAARDAASAHASAALPTAAQHEVIAPAEPAPAADPQPDASPLRLTMADIEAPPVETPFASESVVTAWPAKLTIPQAFRPIGLADLGGGAADPAAEISAITPPRKLELAPAPLAEATPPSHDDDHDEGPIVSRQSQFARPSAAFVEDKGQNGDAGLNDKRFSSLFKNSAPLRAPFIRIEDLEEIGDDADIVAEPTTPFPRVAAIGNVEFPPVSAIADEAPEPAVISRIAGVISPITASVDRQAPAPENSAEAATQDAPQAGGADMAETERALRSALASLQRISGAA